MKKENYKKKGIVSILAIIIICNIISSVLIVFGHSLLLIAIGAGFGIVGILAMPTLVRFISESTYEE